MLQFWHDISILGLVRSKTTISSDNGKEYSKWFAVKIFAWNTNPSKENWSDVTFAENTCPSACLMGHLSGHLRLGPLPTLRIITFCFSTESNFKLEVLHGGAP